MALTPYRIEQVKQKITRIRKALAAEKRRYGCYDDSRGIRYLPPALYIQIADFSGGFTYLRWFHKNFPDDCGLPDFLFEWMLILFMNEKLNDAEIKAFETFCSNTYLLDRFLDQPSISVEKYECSNMEGEAYCTYLKYSCADDSLSLFVTWLRGVIKSKKFVNLSSKFFTIRKQLLSEKDRAIRSALLEQERQLKTEFVSWNDKTIQ
ncbi:MAG: hypothetical protein A4E71_00522 [Smithella sp. PtaU1.Bin162]|nr:MAG: hypothetical protein A4E71_00522 [Smithella sp. PtaU1.Bin162]